MEVVSILQFILILLSIMKILILFSGTGSIEKAIDRYNTTNNTKYEYRGLDIVNKYKPFYHKDILKWNYQEDLKDWIPDYIHASPVCKEFSPLKNGKSQERDMDLGMGLLNKAIEVINWVKSHNENVIYTFENPRGVMRKLDIMKKYNRYTTSYCKYGFSYRKPTDFWSNIELKLKEICGRKKDKSNWCDKMLGNKGIHPVRIGYRGSYINGKKVFYDDLQMMDSKYFQTLKKEDQYKGYSNRDIRYRIPNSLCDSIISQVFSSFNISNATAMMSSISLS